MKIQIHIVAMDGPDGMKVDRFYNEADMWTHLVETILSEGDAEDLDNARQLIARGEFDEVSVLLEDKAGYSDSYTHSLEEIDLTQFESVRGVLDIVKRLSSLCPSDEGLGGHAPVAAFVQLGGEARAALQRLEGKL